LEISGKKLLSLVIKLKVDKLGN